MIWGLFFGFSPFGDWETPCFFFFHFSKLGEKPSGDFKKPRKGWGEILVLFSLLFSGGGGKRKTTLLFFPLDWGPGGFRRKNFNPPGKGGRGKGGALFLTGGPGGGPIGVGFFFFGFPERAGEGKKKKFGGETFFNFFGNLEKGGAREGGKSQKALGGAKFSKKKPIRGPQKGGGLGVLRGPPPACFFFSYDF